MGENLESVRRRIASGTAMDRLRVESNNSVERLSNASPVHWDSLLQNLSAALPVIFHTPATVEKKDDLPHMEPHLHTQKYLHPDRCLLPSRDSSSSRERLSVVETRRPISGTFAAEGVRDISPVLRSKGRSIRVRHEETEERLNQSLTMICRPRSPRDSTSQAPDDGKTVGLKLKESLKSGVRVKIDISQYNLDKIVVAVTADNVLHVYAAGTEKRTLHTLQLSENPPLRSLVCSVIDATSLYIRERSKEAMVLEHTGHTDRFLPVIKLDETSLKFTVIIHIPEEIAFEDVIVKTVDESLVIKGQQSTSLQSPNGPISFRVMMALPEGVDNRSVSACFIDFNQVIVEGCLGVASRRMTCNF